MASFPTLGLSSWRIPTLDGFCCSSLRLGCITIGTCELILNVFSIVLTFTLHTHWQEAMFVQSLFPSDSPSPMIIGTFEFLRYGVASILLIVAAAKSRLNLLIPWLFLAIESMYWEVLKMIVTFVHLSDETVEGNMITFFVFLVTFSLSIYFWLVVFSFYRQLSAEQSFQRLGQTIAIEDGHPPAHESQLEGFTSLSDLHLVKNEVKPNES